MGPWEATLARTPPQTAGGTRARAVPPATTPPPARQALSNIGCAPWPTPGTFGCYNQLCQSGAEYCARGQENGAYQFAMCRPYPGGCTTCACVTADAASVAQPNNQSYNCSA